MAIVRDLSGNGAPQETTGGLQKFAEGITTNASTTVPVPISNTQLLVRSVKFIAQKAQGSANADNVWIGSNAADGSQPDILAPGNITVYTAGEKQKIDLNKLYLDVAAPNDGVCWEAVV